MLALYLLRWGVPIGALDRFPGLSYGAIPGRALSCCSAARPLVGVSALPRSDQCAGAATSTPPATPLPDPGVRSAAAGARKAAASYMARRAADRQWSAGKE